ncbi:MAG: M67 family metallopeptidase [Candidatus Bathyarchaeia archaeon]
MVLKIRSQHLEKIFQHAKKCYPLEACGILVGRVEEEGRIVTKVYHTKNVLESSSSYQIDPIEQLRVFEEAERNGLDVLGFYHSHPLWDSFWSKADEEASKLWEGYVFLIISLKTRATNAYIRKQNSVEKEDVTIL